MDQPNLPRHVVERVERRWAAVLSHQTMTRPQRERVGMTGRVEMWRGGIR